MNKPFQIPNSIQIAGQKIKIRVKDTDGELYGQFHFEKKTIDIDIRVAKSPKLFLETMRHEIFECCLLFSGVGWGEVYQSEQVVRCMDELCYPAIQRLKKALARLNP